jgi:hypothetical protein
VHLIVSWRHWTLSASVGTPSPNLAANDESQFGGSYHTFLTAGGDTSGNNEAWEENINPQLNLGHIVTAVGYIPAGDADDINAPGMPTDWVIVHDNFSATARNVIVPLTAVEYANDWDANTTVSHSLPVTIPLSPNDTYLRTNSDTAGDTPPIDISTLGLQPGMLIQLRRIGDWVGVSGGPDTTTSLSAAFASSNILLGQSNLDRVQDAVDMGVDYATPPTFTGGLQTDIVEDFFVSDTVIGVPNAATHLFAAAPDSRYFDNSDPDVDFAIEIDFVSLPAIPPFGLLALAGMLLAGAASVLARRRNRG